MGCIDLYRFFLERLFNHDAMQWVYAEVCAEADHLLVACHDEEHARRSVDCIANYSIEA